MNLEEFFLELQDHHNEINRFLDDKPREIVRQVDWIWYDVDRLLGILEKIINVGKSGETK